MLGVLPQGLRSHPGCRVKGAVVRSWLLQQPVAFEPGSVPDEIRDLVENPPLPSAWVPSAVARTTWLATADMLFPGDDRGALEWTNRGVARVIGSGLYRALIALASPRLLIRALEVNLRAVNKGTTMASTIEGSSASVTWRYPVGIVPRLMADVTANALELLLSAARAEHPRVGVASLSPTMCRFSASWEPAWRARKA